MELNLDLLKNDAKNIEGEFNVTMTVTSLNPEIAVKVVPAPERTDRELLDAGVKSQRTVELLLTKLEAESKSYEPEAEQSVTLLGKKYKIDDIHEDPEGTHYILNLRRNFSNTVAAL